jgi:acetyl-CoA synthetase
MSDKMYEVPAAWTKRAYIDAAKYRAMYQRSLETPDAFWREEGICLCKMVFWRYSAC